ncbi:unnamed protein product [Leptosia nina]|uniref:MGA conserved domain-containing protein n=1 Tax=Leptosia nina TaxID=320188 RepID=A0AAV1JRE0_9NEOP
MEDDLKVFKSSIIRSKNTCNNDLYDLLKIVPATPLSVNVVTAPIICDFIPKSGKYYVPKKKSKLKVKTLRNIREFYERDIYDTLNVELEKHKNSLLRKIRTGSSKEDTTKKMAHNLLRNNCPVSRHVWQMLTNLNPENHPYSKQFVLWNRSSIQVNGSKGGKNKFISSFDIGENNIKHLNKSSKLNKICPKKKLLRSSLHVKFKPGPLSKKKYLDASYQKFQFGDAAIVNLPKPGLDIQPSYGIPLGSTLINFISDSFMQNSNGEITEKWANFSVSMVGFNNKGSALQIHKDGPTTFDLTYKCNQSRILMRNAYDNIRQSTLTPSLDNDESSIADDVNTIMSKMLDYVEIKQEQENRYNIDGEDISCNSDKTRNRDTVFKDKCKRKFGELGRLDVRVIRLSHVESENSKCNRDFCTLGCICDSLNASYNLKTHCGRVECMFECKCRLTLRNDNESHCNSFTLSGINDLNNTLNIGLAKEEQKFQQTVVLSGEKSILIKPRKRDWKSSKKYADFYSNLCLKTENKPKKELFIITPKLNCDSIEPWCMVHNLYKCFCKGKFTERLIPTEESIRFENNKELSDSVVQDSNMTINIPVKDKLRVRPQNENVTITIDLEKYNSYTVNEIREKDPQAVCARVNLYQGRKYNDSYYMETNKKIVEMEKNDDSLLKKLKSLMNISDPEMSLGVVSQSNEDIKNDNFMSNNWQPDKYYKVLFKKQILNTWIEANYRSYKKHKDQGLVSTILKPPIKGKLAFYTWDLIYDRYREQKNLFFMSPVKPYRIFIARKIDDPKPQACQDFRELDLTNIEKYPAVVKSFLSSTNNLKDSFCVLLGWSHCWELISTVSKIEEPKATESLNTSNCDLTESSSNSTDFFTNCPTFSDDNSQDNSVDLKDYVDVESFGKKDIDFECHISENNNKSCSKWFVMTVEHDFDEIHFYNKGFFVKHESILKAINISRVSKKTVRLSSQKTTEGDDPQFGIYAIPNERELNVFIGPYEQDEQLGIETVKLTLPKDSTRQTRGTWLNVNKIENSKIIDTPMSFLTSTLEVQTMIPLERAISSMQPNIVGEQCKETNTNNINLQATETKVTVAKTVKPIKIRKSDGFFQIDKLKTIMSNLSPGNRNRKIFKTVDTSEIKEKLIKMSKPVAEIAPQIKAVEQKSGTKSLQKSGMSVLKPEEINKRLLEPSQPSSTLRIVYEDIEKDIEKFLETATVCQPPPDDVYVISDDEGDTSDIIDDVWIQSTNIPTLGWIPAKRNRKGEISFEFPGFKYTEFYNETVAISKINSVFSRRVYVPRLLELKWEIVDDIKKIQGRKKMLASDLRPDCIMTAKGLKLRGDLVKILKQKRKLLDKETTKEGTKKRKLLTHLQDMTSSSLENENSLLSNEDVIKREDILHSISEASNRQRQEMRDRLSALLTNSEVAIVL